MGVHETNPSPRPYGAPLPGAPPIELGTTRLASATMLQRVTAALVDSILVAIPLSVSFFAGDDHRLAGIPALTIFAAVGLVVTIQLRTLRRSSQSIGQRFAMVRVAVGNGEGAPFAKAAFSRALLVASFLGLPIFKVNFELTTTAIVLPEALSAAVGLILHTFAIANLACFVFPGRRCLHDYLLGTYVATLDPHDRRA